MKIKVPDSILIGLHSYEVIFNPHLQIDEERVGTLNRRTQTLEIENALAQSQKEVTLWHEIIHGISGNFSLALSEKDTDNLAIGIVQFLQDNFGIEFDFSDIPVKEE